MNSMQMNMLHNSLVWFTQLYLLKCQIVNICLWFTVDLRNLILIKKFTSHYINVLVIKAYWMWATTIFQACTVNKSIGSEIVFVDFLGLDSIVSKITTDQIQITVWCSYRLMKIWYFEIDVNVNCLESLRFL